jgi:hypothetical protein
MAQPEDLCLVGIGGEALQPTKEKMVKFCLRSRDGKYTTQHMSACTTEKITNPLRMVDVDPKNLTVKVIKKLTELNIFI